MIRRRSDASMLEREIGWASTAFLEGRLAEKDTFDWAAGLGSDKVAERNAIRTLLHYRTPDLEEPHRTAWFWVCEAWDEPTCPEETRLEMTEALQRGVAPVTFVRHVVELVRPRLSIEPARQPRRKGRAIEVSQLISLRLGVEEIVSLEDLELNTLDDPAFFNFLADRLESELRVGLARAQRIGGSALYLTNWIARVYPAQLIDPNGGLSDPDEHRGFFAPLVKLLHEVLAKLFTIRPDAARKRAKGWLEYPDPLFQRLWAAAARNSGLATPDEVARFLRTINADRFWGISHYPEITELRGHRFAELWQNDQAAIEKRLLQSPPAAIFLRRLSKTERNAARRSWIRRELQRIEIGGGPISRTAQAWVTDFDASGDTFSALTTVTSDLDNAYNFAWPMKTGEYDATDIKDLLPTLERDLADTGFGGKAEQAAAYVESKADEALEGLGASEAGRFPRILASLAETEANRGRGGDAAAPAGVDVRPGKMLDNLVRLPSGDLKDNAGAFAGWMDVWAKHMAADPRVWATWLRLWPSAVALSNKTRMVVPSSSGGDREPQNNRLAIESHSSAAGHLISAFFNVLPNLTVVPHPFENVDLRRVRDAAFTATGDARLQVLHRFLSTVDYMRLADREWAEANLLHPLEQAEHQDLEIWDAIASRGISRESLKIVGQRLAVIARGGTLPPKTRAGLAQTATYWALRDLQDGVAEPAIAMADVQQMLRLGGDQVRVAAACTLKDFVQSKNTEPSSQFTSAVGPFLAQVWPADQTLRSAPLAEALSKLPAETGSAFPAAVAAIADLLVPFDAWSLFAFGFYPKLAESDGSGRAKAAPILNPEGAGAWLNLLDLSIGRSEGAVYPRDLALALDSIAAGDKSLTADARFHRLVALVRK